MSYLKDVLDSRELLANLTMREIKGKYRRTALGQLWSLGDPPRNIEERAERSQPFVQRVKTSVRDRPAS